jgi:hypothetical protein
MRVLCCWRLGFGTFLGFLLGCICLGLFRRFILVDLGRNRFWYCWGFFIIFVMIANIFMK